MCFVLLIWHPEGNPLEHTYVYFGMVATYWGVALGRLQLMSHSSSWPRWMARTRRCQGPGPTQLSTILFAVYTALTVLVPGLMYLNSSRYDYHKCDFWLEDVGTGTWTLAPWGAYLNFTEAQQKSCEQKPAVPAWLLQTLDTMYTLLLGSAKAQHMQHRPPARVVHV